MKRLYDKGQVTMLGAIAVGIITMVGGVFSAKITADSAIKEKIAEVNTSAAVVAAQVASNEKNSTARLDRLEDKIDWLIRQQGGIPTQIIAPTVPGTTIRSSAQ